LKDCAIKIRRKNNMLKNTKAVGIAAAIALLTGVAFAPSATAVGTNKPEQSLDNGTSYDSGERIDYYVEYVRTHCTVTTTVGNKSKTAVARQDDSSDVLTFGEVNSFIGAPSIAGEYTVASQVSNSCKDDAGYKWAENMADDITVGDDIDPDLAAEDVLNSTNASITGTMELAASGEDLGNVKVTLSIGGKVVATSTTNASGEISWQVARSHFKKIGATRVVVKMAPNKLFYLADGLFALYVSRSDFS